MSTDFALDLRVSRRKAGFSQRDVAHLLGTYQPLVSELERGRQLPSLEHIVTLSLIFGRSFESLFGALMKTARDQLRQRILRMPDEGRCYVGSFNREASIERLAQRLADEHTDYGNA
jgi:transcriptional regulator with XRE-family HTH domain